MRMHRRMTRRSTATGFHMQLDIPLPVSPPHQRATPRLMAVARRRLAGAAPFASMR
jgi:hypothetical protein